MTNFGQMLKQAQAMQQKMEEIQANMEALEVTGQAGGGVVTVTLNGKGVLKAIDIAASLLNEDDKDVIEDLIVAAHADAKGKIDQIMKDEMAAATGGLDLPPGMKLPF